MWRNCLFRIFFITVEFSVVGNEMPEHIESFIWEKYQAILHGANGRKFCLYRRRVASCFSLSLPTDKVVDERYALKNKGADEVSQIKKRFLVSDWESNKLFTF
mgnify:CR=1 FL=1